MSDFDFGDAISKWGKGMGKMYGVPQVGPSDTKIDTAAEPPLVSVPPEATAQQEQQAANSVASNVASPVQAPSPQPAQPQVAAQPPMQPGMVPLQQTVTGSAVDPMAKSEQRMAGMAVDDAIQSKAQADIEANNVAVAESRAKAALLQKEANDAAALNAERQKQADDKRAAIESAVQERDAFKFDPNRAKKNMGVGGQILAIIGQSLGAFGAAITHSPNYAQQLIDKAIDADLHSQSNEYAALGAKVDSRRNDYAAFRQQGLDDDQAKTGARLLKLQQVAAEYDSLMADKKNPQLLAAAGQLKALNQQKQADVAAEYGKRQISTTSAPMQMPGPKSVEDQMRLRSLEVDVPQYDLKTGKENGNKTYMAKSAQDAEKARDAMTVSRTIKTNLARMKKLVETTSQSINPTAKIEVQKLNDQLATQFGVLNHLGALSDKDYQIASQLGDPTSLFQRDSTTLKLLDQYQANLDTMVEGELRGRGIIK